MKIKKIMKKFSLSLKYVQLELYRKLRIIVMINPIEKMESYYNFILFWIDWYKWFQ